jgi:WD40 repeat protein
MIDEEIERLPEAYRLPMILVCLDGRSLEEAARHLGWTPGSVKGRLERGRARLHRRLVQRGLTLSAALAAVEVSRSVAAATADTAVARLLTPTVRGAVSLTTRPTATAFGISAESAALADQVLKSMALAKLKLNIVLMLALGIVAAAAGFSAHRGLFAQAANHAPAKPVPGSQEQARTEKTAGTDRYGDPLPEGAIERLGTLRFRQGGGVVSGLFITPDGKTLISNSFAGDRTVCAWELATGKLLRQFPGHRDENGAVAVSPDGTELAIGQDAVIHFYDLASGRELRQIKSPLGGTEGLAFSPDGRMLASGHERQTVILWDLASTGGRELVRLAAEQNKLTLLAFSADGKTLAASGMLDKTIRLFDTATFRERRRLTRAVELFDWVYSHNAFAISPQGSTLAVAVKGGSIIQLREAATGKLVRELLGAGKYINALAWSPNGRTLAGGYHAPKGQGGTIHVWDAATGKEQRAIDTQGEVIQSLTFTGDGRKLISGGGNSVIRLWDLDTGKERPPAQGLRAPIGWMAQSRDGRTLAFNDWDIRLLDRTTGREIGTIPVRHGSFAFSPEGKTLAVTGDGVNLWDVASRRLIRRLQVATKREDGTPYDGYSSLAFSPDGKLVAGSGGVYRTRRGVNVTDDTVVQLWDTATGKKLRRLSMKAAASDLCPVDAIAFSPDGKKLIASGRSQSPDFLADSKVCVYEVPTLKPITRLSAAFSDFSKDASAPSTLRLDRPDVIPRIVFSPDGKMLAMNRAQKTIPVWEAATGRRRLVLEGHEESTAVVAFAPDGRTLASSSWDNTIRLWDLETGKELRKLTGHRGKAASLLFSVDGKTLISAGDDTTVLFWDVAAVTHRVRPRATPLSVNEWDALWQDLAGADAAYRAINTLSAAPARAVAFLQKRLRPAHAPNAKRIARLIDDLDSRNFAARERATQELEALGEAAEPALRRSLQKRPSLEFRRRVERVLVSLALPSGDGLRALRAIEVLERIDTPEAKKLLAALARGAVEARLTHEAKASLERLAKRSSHTR